MKEDNRVPAIFNPQDSIFVDASDGHGPGFYYRVGFGPEEWDHGSVPVFKDQIFDPRIGRINGRQPASKPAKIGRQTATCNELWEVIRAYIQLARQNDVAVPEDLQAALPPRLFRP
jgi:hypothetical protein